LPIGWRSRTPNARAVANEQQSPPVLVVELSEIRDTADKIGGLLWTVPDQQPPMTVDWFLGSVQSSGFVGVTPGQPETDAMTSVRSIAGSTRRPVSSHDS
jgi:hypothetical protein